MSELSDTSRGRRESCRAFAGASRRDEVSIVRCEKALEPLPLKIAGSFSVNFKGFGCCAAAKKCRDQTVDALRATA
ncbi:hypothetical protein [Thauera sp. SDU_THAU2]|uniref:hypothetical protein n=1 Tax=Thauera sp. SDU_THAU2 TaxID=3136633 RepID=UPI00311DC9A8